MNATVKPKSHGIYRLEQRSLYRVDGLMHSDSASFVNSFYWTGALGGIVTTWAFFLARMSAIG